MSSLFDHIDKWYDAAIDYIHTHPRAGFLIALVLLLIMLAGNVFNWKWGGWNNPNGWVGYFWQDLLGPTTYRFYQGVVIVIAILLLLALYFLYY